MDDQDIQRIRKRADDLARLRDWEIHDLSVQVDQIEKLVPPGMDRTTRIAEGIGQEWDRILDPHRMEYRMMVRGLCGDDAWDPIASILEVYNAQTAQRLDGKRRAILDQVSSGDQLKASLEMHGHSLGPNVPLRGVITQLIEALLDTARRAEIPEDGTRAAAIVNAQSFNVTINIEQHIANLRDAVTAQPEDSPTFTTVTKKTALDIIGNAVKDVAKGQVKEAAKQIYGLGKDLGPVIVDTVAYRLFKSYLGL